MVVSGGTGGSVWREGCWCLQRQVMASTVTDICVCNGMCWCLERQVLLVSAGTGVGVSRERC